MVCAAPCDKVVHFGQIAHNGVTQTPDFPSNCQVVNKISIEFNGLLNRLFFKQTGERCRIQRKSASSEIFSAELSTQTVDSFALAPPHASLQRPPRIVVSEMGLFA
jgi:hypothetical protein